ncbi:diaminopimelate epimerase [candidate division KSB1 bacterium]
MKLLFEKYSAHGNDFIIIDNRYHRIEGDNRRLFQHLCQRRTSVGADGVILLDSDNVVEHPQMPKGMPCGTSLGAPPKPAVHRIADYHLEFYNSDGNPTTMCGNGSRAAVDFAKRLDIMTKECRFTVNEREYRGQIAQDGTIGVEIHLCGEEAAERSIIYDSTEYKGYVCNSGVPHTVIFDTGLFQDSPRKMAAHLRNVSDFAPEGANVSFARIDSSDHISIITYERGVEDYTLSCGTAAAAVGFISYVNNRYSLPIKVRSAGGTLDVTSSDKRSSVWIMGKVFHIYSGVIEEIIFT